MNTIDDGGPASPYDGFNGWGEPNQHMTLRDYFAGLAMQGWVADEPVDRFDQCAKYSYMMADAMLEARKK